MKVNLQNKNTWPKKSSDCKPKQAYDIYLQKSTTINKPVDKMKTEISAAYQRTFTKHIEWGDNQILMFSSCHQLFLRVVDWIFLAVLLRYYYILYRKDGWWLAYSGKCAIHGVGWSVMKFQFFFLVWKLDYILSELNKIKPLKQRKISLLQASEQS